MFKGESYMQFRESFMPQEDYWNTFFDPLSALQKLGLKQDTDLIIDVGCGYGTFAIPAAKFIRGKVIGIDIDQEMVKLCKQKALNLGLKNVVFTVKDIAQEGMGINPESADSVFLFNILHCEAPLNLLSATYQSLKVGGKALIMHWRYDETTPRGPSMGIRPKPSQIIEWSQRIGFNFLQEIDLQPYHYGLIFEK